MCHSSVRKSVYVWILSQRSRWSFFSFCISICCEKYRKLTLFSICVFAFEFGETFYFFYRFKPLNFVLIFIPLFKGLTTQLLITVIYIFLRTTTIADNWSEKEHSIGCLLQASLKIIIGRLISISLSFVTHCKRFMILKNLLQLYYITINLRVFLRTLNIFRVR